MSGLRIGLAVTVLAVAAPGGSPGDSLFGDAPPAERLRPPRVPASPDAGGPFSPPEAGGFLALLAGGGLLIAARLRGGASPEGGGGGSDEEESVRHGLRRLEGRLDETGGPELCRELTTILRTHLDREREGGLPPGRPVRRALPPGDPLASELGRWEAVRFGGAPMDAEARRRAVRTVRERVLSDGPGP